MMRNKGVSYFVLSMIISGVLCAILILDNDNNVWNYNSTTYYVNYGMDYNRIEAFSQQKSFVMNKKQAYVNPPTKVPITNFAEMSKITNTGQTEAESMLETTYSAAMPFAEKKTTGAGNNTIDGFSGFFGSRSTTDNNSDEEYAQNTTMYIDHSNINNQLKTMGLNTDMEEDPFDPGAGNDNDGAYNDVPIGDGSVIILMLMAIYVCFKFRKIIIKNIRVFMLKLTKQLKYKKLTLSTRLQRREHAKTFLSANL